MNLSSLLSKDLILLDFRAKEHAKASQGRDVESIFEEVKMDKLFQTLFTRTHVPKLADILVIRVMEKFEIRNI
jgi:hypothetical protein